MSTTTVTRAQNTVIASANALRGRVFALDLELGVEFTRSLSDGWDRHRVDGVRAACWSLAAELAGRPGTWDLYTAARDLASNG